jgi:hypothetical protein
VSLAETPLQFITLSKTEPLPVGARWLPSDRRGVTLIHSRLPFLAFGIVIDRVLKPSDDRYLEQRELIERKPVSTRRRHHAIRSS